MAQVALLVADLTGIDPAQLRDATLLAGLVIAAVGAAGLNAEGMPAVRDRGDDGVSLLQPLQDGHFALHTYPARGVLLLDVLGPPGKDARKVVDVLARRLNPGAVRTGTRERA